MATRDRKLIGSLTNSPRMSVSTRDWKRQGPVLLSVWMWQSPAETLILISCYQRSFCCLQSQYLWSFAGFPKCHLSEQDCEYTLTLLLLFYQMILWKKSIHIPGCHERDSVAQSWKALRDCPMLIVRRWGNRHGGGVLAREPRWVSSAPKNKGLTLDSSFLTWPSASRGLLAPQTYREESTETCPVTLTF